MRALVAVPVLLAACRAVPVEPAPGLALEPARAETIHDAIEGAAAAAVLVNVWATWCEPCKKEMPDLLALRRRHAARGFRLILVSADVPQERDSALAFLRAQGVDFLTYIKAETDMGFINGLSSAWSGALPASLLFNRRGSLVRFWEGEVDLADIEREITPLL